MIRKAFYILIATATFSFISCDDNNNDTPNPPEGPAIENEGTPTEDEEATTDGETGSTGEKILFDAADLDENGWLWFDTAEKIDKYIGVINETDYLVDLEGKPIQMVYADIQPDYPATEASADFIGAGTDGETGSEGSRTGAIMLQPSSNSMTINGGGFIVCMPACHSYSICYSSNSRVMARLVATTNPNAPMGNSLAECRLDSENGWRIISAEYASIFKRLPKGINTWGNLETLDNGYEPITTIQSEEPINIWFQSATADTIYIHGIKAEIKKRTEEEGFVNIKKGE